MLTLPVAHFLQHKAPLVDVRSPSEFTQGHIKDAVNIPLLDDQERKEVGTLYKKVGFKEAFLLGLHYVGPKIRDLVGTLQGLSKECFLRIYCFRGGLRSSSIAHLLQQSGIQMVTLEGGYKAYRSFCLNHLSQRYNLCLIGGPTGSGKTEFLKELKKCGEQVIDLEHFASHRGSVFGHVHEKPQPSQEQFENRIAETLFSFNKEKKIFVEDESRLIGSLKIPDPFFKNMDSSPLILIKCPLEKRIDYLLNSYTPIPLEEFTKCLLRIRKKLGNGRMQEIIQHAESGNWREAVHILLLYYDKAYRNRLTSKTPITIIER